MEITNQYGALGVGFADDCCILVQHKNINNSMGYLQRITDELVEWGQTIGLTFNPTKTVCMIFHKHNLNNITYPNRKLKINNKEIEFSRSTRYLGLTLDDKLSWTEHFNKITKRAKQYMMQLLGTFCKSWGPKPNLVKWVYGSIVLARLCYAPMTWGYNIKQIYKTNKLRQINRLASLMMCPTRRKTPTEALEVINDLAPLEIYIQQQALKTYTRLEDQLDYDWSKLKIRNKQITPHLKYLKDLKSNITGGMIDTETTHRDISEKDYDIKIDPIKGKDRPTSSQINIYTDGSKTKVLRPNHIMYISI